VNWRRWTITSAGIAILITSCQGATSPTATPELPESHSPTPTRSAPTVTPSPTGTSEPLLRGTVELWIDWTQDEINALYSNLQRFQSQFPLVEISISFHTPDHLLSDFQVAVRNGEGPDLLIGPSEWGDLLLAEGMIRDISDRVLQELIATLHPLAWQSVTRGRAIIGLPLTMEGIVLYRNTALVDSPPETLDDLIESALAVEEAGNRRGMFDLGFFNSGAFLQSCGGKLVDDFGGLALSPQAGECWLGILDDWSQAGRAVFNTDEDYEAFAQGEIPWLIDDSTKAEELFSALGEDGLAIDPWPIYSPIERRLLGYAWTRNIYFASSTEATQFDAAWVLARYLLTEDIQLSLAKVRSGRQFPVLKEAEFEERSLHEMLLALNENIALPLYPEFAVFAEVLEEAAVDVTQRGYDPYWSIRFILPKLERSLP
jgi:ABC-type glycerol-3-phosphate transport system substrate-binding protein